jgi:hypothetical protein
MSPRPNMREVRKLTLSFDQVFQIIADALVTKGQAKPDDWVRISTRLTWDCREGEFLVTVLTADDTTGAERG